MIKYVKTWLNFEYTLIFSTKSYPFNFMEVEQDWEAFGFTLFSNLAY